MERFVCVTCGTQFPDADDAAAERARSATTRASTSRSRASSGRRSPSCAPTTATRSGDEGALTGIGTEPHVRDRPARAARPARRANLLWDCVTLLDDATAAAVERRGGLAAIAISHPHYYSAMVEWAHRFDCPVLPARGRPRVGHAARPRDRVLGGRDARPRRRADADPLRRPLRRRHRAAPARRGRAAVAATSSRSSPTARWVCFMYSYPNLIPLPEAAVQAMARRARAVRVRARSTAPGGARSSRRDGAGIVRRSAERYARALREVLG